MNLGRNCLARLRGFHAGSENLLGIRSLEGNKNLYLSITTASWPSKVNTTIRCLIT